ncbi:TetR family transcriptional regulator [Corynebacterium sp.]|uniref:TetR family transcriptional regulator n=1 Tax=Corynebacterium sp. TaxID=1720 RepID=UPI0026DA8217|nr:TetR family transcriptional regulator [Corynebacterium sp.]
MSLPHFSPHQLLHIADVFCTDYHVDVVDYAALCACAAVTSASIAGVRVHKTSHAAEESLKKSIMKLQPLSGKNDSFALFAASVYRTFGEYRHQ